jgi:hypothetical protein
LTISRLIGIAIFGGAPGPPIAIYLIAIKSAKKGSFAMTETMLRNEFIYSVEVTTRR